MARMDAEVDLEVWKRFLEVDIDTSAGDIVEEGTEGGNVQVGIVELGEVPHMVAPISIGSDCQLAEGSAVKRVVYVEPEFHCFLTLVFP